MGTVIGLLVASIITGIGSYIIIKHNLKRDKEIEEIKISVDIKYMKYVWAILIINVCLAYFTNIDMLVVKKYFSTQEAGIYSTSILFSKLMLYIPNALATAMFPIAIEQKLLQNSSINILKKSISYVLGFSVMCYIGMSLFGEHIIKILFGNRYIIAVPYVSAALIMAIPIGIYIIIINFFMVIDKMKLLLWTSSGACLISYGILNFYHDSIYQVIGVLTIMNTLVVLSNLIYIFITNRKGL
jgi:O-antigen/teichoic acid export membrane protein